MQLSSVIQAVSHYVPERIVTNDELAQVMDTSDTWIRERTGIEQRRFVEPGTPTSELAARAAAEVLEKAQCRSVDLIVAATLSPDLYFPGIGTMVQHRLELGHVPALDIRAQCSGLVYGIACADAFIRSRQAKSVLLVCAEVQSPVLEMNDRGRDMAVLFGDGAAAVLLTAEENETGVSINSSQRGVIDSLLGGDGAGAEILCLKTPGSATPGFLKAESYADGTWHPYMEGRVVFKNAVQRMTEVGSAILQRNGLTPDQIDLLIPHQANLRINEAVRSHLGIAEEKVFNNIQRYGNTTAATIPIAMSEAEAEGKLRRGDLLLTLAFGAGFTWGANLIRW